MSTAVMPKSRSVAALARVETLRLARHPFFLAGVLATAAFLSMSLGTSFDYYNIAITPAFFIGMFSMVAMFRLTRSMQRTEEALGSAPSSSQDRVLALCLACLLPAALGVLSFVAILAFQHASEPFAYGTMGQSNRVALFVGEVVVACLGGPLLGVAAGRWLRFPGAPAAVFVAMLFVVLLGEGVTSSARNATWSTIVRLLSPWTQFTSVESNDRQVEIWRGSPTWHIGWLLALCVLAVLAALLKDAEGERRAKLLRTGLVVGLVGLGFLVLAVVMGPDYATLSTPSGVTRF
jgi:hypothetical protein